MDALSEVLKVVKLESAFFFNAEFSAPWRFRSPDSCQLARFIQRAGEHVILYHLFLKGSAYAETRDMRLQQVDEVKTAESRRQMPVDASLLDVLKTWKQMTLFPNNEDWMFASPVQLGRLPWSYDQIWRVYQKAATAAGIGGLGTHSLRHTYRSWLDSVGTPVGIQQKLRRHADIRTTMNVYGDTATDDMSQAHSKVVGLALNGAQPERKAS